MNDTDLVNCIIKTLCKSGWCGTNRENLTNQIDKIIIDFKDQNERLLRIRQEVMK